jgi:hypothetical protein
MQKPGSGFSGEPEVARQLTATVVAKTTAFDPQWDAKSLKEIRVSFPS